MYKNCLEKHQNLQVYYYLYRTLVKKKYIYFAKLGHEECEQCEGFKLHSHTQSDMNYNCDICKVGKTHIEMASKSRDLYRTYSENKHYRRSSCYQEWTRSKKFYLFQD